MRDDGDGVVAVEGEGFFAEGVEGGRVEDVPPRLQLGGERKRSAGRSRTNDVASS